MKKLFTLLTMLIVAITSSWAITPVTKTYGGKTFLDVTNTTKNVTVGTTNYVTLLKADFSGAWYTGGTSNTGNVGGSFDADKMPGFISNNWNAGLSIKNSNGYIRAFFVTGTTGVAILGNDNTTTNILKIVVEEVDANGELSAVGSVNGEGKTSAYVLPYPDGLSASKYYKITITSDASSNSRFSQIRFTQPSATPVGPVDPDFSLSAYEVEVGSTISVNGPTGLSFNAEPVSGTTGAVSVSSGTITGVTAGAAQVRVTSVATSEYNAYDHTFEITVTAPKCATPTISPATFDTDNQEVTITSETAGATIYYTTDGTDPTESSNVYNPENEPTISSTTTFKAIAVKENYDNSEVATQKVTRTSSAVVANWNFTNWSDATKTGTIADGTNWSKYEKTNSGGMDFGENGRSHKDAISSGSTLKYNGTNNIDETNGLTFAADAYGLALIFNIGSATVSKKEYTYHGSSYLWLYNENAIITIPSVPAGATIEIGVESHNGGTERGVTLKNGSNTLTQTQGAATSKVYQVCKWTNATAGNVTVKPSAGLHIYYITVTGNAETVPVSTVGSNNYATYVTESNLDFSSVSDEITAYIATADNGTTITTEAVTEVPTGTALLIKTANPGSTVNVPVAASTPATLTDNKLKFSNESLVITSDDATAKRYYGFFKVGGKYGFAPMKAGTLAAKKAYLEYESNTSHFIALDLEDAPTAIDFVEAENNANSAAPIKVIKNGKLYIGNYNVAGQQVK